jgi:hypothetical protein
VQNAGGLSQLVIACIALSLIGTMLWAGNTAIVFRLWFHVRKRTKARSYSISTLCVVSLAVFINECLACYVLISTDIASIFVLLNQSILVTAGVVKLVLLNVRPQQK